MLRVSSWVCLGVSFVVLGVAGFDHVVNRPELTEPQALREYWGYYLAGFLTFAAGMVFKAGHELRNEGGV